MLHSLLASALPASLQSQEFIQECGAAMVAGIKVGIFAELASWLNGRLSGTRGR